MYQVNIHEAKTHLSRLIQKVLEGEEVVIARDHHPVVKLVSANKLPIRRSLGFAKGQVWIADDFDTPLPEFEPYS